VHGVLQVCRFAKEGEMINLRYQGREAGRQGGREGRWVGGREEGHPSTAHPKPINAPRWAPLNRAHGTQLPENPHESCNGTDGRRRIAAAPIVIAERAVQAVESVRVMTMGKQVLARVLALLLLAGLVALAVLLSKP
jgi:hypothetical protein